jgi:molybdopterin synthase catalytic subunit
MQTEPVLSGLCPDSIDAQNAIDTIALPTCGAVVAFEGRIRNHHNGRQVEALFYEAYESVAERQLRELTSQAIDKFELGGAVALHRIGNVALGDIAVLVATASPHRPAAFDGTRWLIDEIKANVAIWKKEMYTDGSSWVGLDECHSP